MIKALIKEIKRHNDLREKELDLKILDRFDFHTKYKVWPKRENINTQVVYHSTPQPYNGPVNYTESATHKI
jgi:hypothetical protein